ncbi:MAG: hypothetical protein IH845_00915 [Nanoarchaeota archaeon]|nr:hypothetical protein [Nanoarchaeota archaeon]
MKIGASPLYLIPGQEKKLEDQVEHLRSIEKEAYMRLKEKKILIDESEEPRIRVALRDLKDFAKPFRLQDKIAWRYAFTPEEEIKNIINKEETSEEELKSSEKTESRAKEETPKEKTESKKIEKIFNKENQSVKIQKPEFLIELKEYLKSEKIEFLKEIKTEKKEIVAKVNISTTLGDINFLLIAKNKMTISKEEINSCLQQGNYNNMPCLLIIRKEPPKNIKELLQNNHLIKLKVM